MAVRFGVVTRVRKLESLAFLAGSEGMAGELGIEMWRINGELSSAAVSLLVLLFCQ